MKLDFKNGLPELFEEAGRVRMEPPSTGTKFRLAGLASDAAEVAGRLRSEVLEKARKEVSLDVDHVDYGELSEQVLGLMLEAPAGCDDELSDQVLQVNEALEGLSSVLADIADELSRHLTIEEYERLCHEETKRYSNTGAGRRERKTYLEWREKECYGTPDMEALLEYRFDKLLSMFDSGVFAAEVSHMRSTRKHPGEIDFETIEDPEQRRRSYRNYHALRKLMDYNDGLLTVNAYHMGHHFFTTKDEPNAKSRRNLLLKYVKKIELAQEDMLRLRAEEAEGRKSKGDEPNLFAPAKNLKELLRQPWFKKLRTNPTYNETWTDGLVNALMASEWGKSIAKDWAAKGTRNKRTQIRGYIIGLLADAGVLKGSNDAIAQEVNLADVPPRSFSRYMGMGKRQPYAAVVHDYVK